MFGIFTGTIVNAITVIFGALLGLIFRGERVSLIGDRIFQLFALFVMVLGISGASDIKHPIFMLVSIAVGTIIGELVDLDDKFNRMGAFLEARFSRGGDSAFVKSFVSGATLFCVGSMTIMGAMQSGLENTHTIFYTKSVIDGVSACVFCMGGGIGVAFSSIFVLLYQGALTACASLLTPIMTEEIVALSSAVGSLTLIAISLNMPKLTNFKVANYLPCMFIPIIYQAIIIIFGLNGII